MSLISSLKKKKSLQQKLPLSYYLVSIERKSTSIKNQPFPSFLIIWKVTQKSDYFYALINLTPPCKYLTNIQETNMQTLIVLNKYSDID